MQNLPSIANITLPAHLVARAAASKVTAAALAAATGESVPRISLKQARFRIVEGGDEMLINTLHLDTTVVGVVPGVSKTFYLKKWTPDQEATAPDCYSVDGTYPSPRATTPQCASCAACPHNVFGSKITELGKETKACADSRRLAVVASDDVEGTVYQLVLPTMSMKPFNKYVKELAMRNIPIEYVRTRLSFNTDVTYPMLDFTFAGFLDEEGSAAIEGIVTSDNTKHVLGLDDVASGPASPSEAFEQAAVPAPVPTPKAAPKAAPAPKQAAPKPAPAPVIEEAEEVEDAPAPKKRGFAAAAAPVAAPVEAPAKKRGFSAAPSSGNVAAPVAPAPVHAGVDALANELGDMFDGEVDM
jgi:hypothetical protein